MRRQQPTNFSFTLRLSVLILCTNFKIICNHRKRGCMPCAYMTWWRWRSIYRTCKIIPVDYFLLWHYLFAIDSKGALEIIIIRPCIDTRARKIFNAVVISICNRVFFSICWTLNANTTTTDIYPNDGGKIYTECAPSYEKDDLFQPLVLFFLFIVWLKFIPWFSQRRNLIGSHLNCCHLNEKPFVDRYT